MSSDWVQLIDDLNITKNEVMILYQWQEEEKDWQNHMAAKTTFLGSEVNAFITSSTRIICASSQVTWFVRRIWLSPSIRRKISLSTKSTKSMHPFFIRKKNISENTSHSCQQFISAINQYEEMKLVYQNKCYKKLPTICDTNFHSNFPECIHQVNPFI